VAAGQSVQVQVASVQSDGSLVAGQVTYLQATGQQMVVGTFIGVDPLPLPAGQSVLEVILHQSPTSNASLPLGGLALVAVSSTGSTPTAFSIDSNGFTIPSGFTFESVNDLAIGQTLQVTVVPGTLGPVTDPVISPGGWGPPAQLSFTASNVALEPSQITGSVASIGTGGTFGLSIYPTFIGPVSPTFQVELIAETTSQTTFQGFSTDSFSGLAAGDVVSVNGWLFPQNGLLNPAIGPPIILAQTVTLHTGGMF
jgi:hypothetical protein